MDDISKYPGYVAPKAPAKTMRGRLAADEKDRKARVKAYEDEIRELERLEEQLVRRKKALGELSVEDEIQSLNLSKERYEGYIQEVLRLTYMTEEEKRRIIAKYRQEADRAELESIKLMRQAQKEAYEESLEDSYDYIKKRNFYNDWGADNEVKAWERVIANAEAAKEAGVISFKEFLEITEDAQMKMYSAAQKELERQAEERKQMLSQELDEQVGMYERQLEEKREALRAEAEAVKENADRQIEQIDRLIQKRRRAKEDKEDGLDLERLQNSLDYTMDEDNRRALGKAIDTKQEEIGDRDFMRKMADKKAAVKANEKLELERIKRLEKAETEMTKEKIDLTVQYYKSRMNEVNLAKEIEKGVDTKRLETVGTGIGEAIAKGIRAALGNINVSAMVGGGGQVVNNNTSTTTNSTTKNFSPSVTLSGSGLKTASQVTKEFQKLYNQFELGGKL